MLSELVDAAMADQRGDIENRAALLPRHRHADRDQTPRPTLPVMGWCHTEFPGGPLQGSRVDFEAAVPPTGVDITHDNLDPVTGEEGPGALSTSARRQIQIDDELTYQMVQKSSAGQEGTG